MAGWGAHLSSIQIGDSGHYVRAWQRVVGVPPSKADGKFGINTDALVRKWQDARGIESDGVLGPLCRAALKPGDLIKPYEWCVLQAYDDERKSPLSARLLHRVGGAWFRADGFPCRGVPTIGWGDTAAPRRGVERCTQAEADQWFAADLEQTRMPAIRRYASQAWDAGQVLATCSFAYNCGTGALAGLASHGFSEESWLSYCHVGAVKDAGLLMRRQEEFAMWAAGL